MILPAYYRSFIITVAFIESEVSAWNFYQALIAEYFYFVSSCKFQEFKEVLVIKQNLEIPAASGIAFFRIALIHYADPFMSPRVTRSALSLLRSVIIFATVAFKFVVVAAVVTLVTTAS